MIRRINQEDINQIYQIEQEVFTKSDQYKNIEKLLLNPNYFIIGNFQKNKLISYIIGIKLNDQFEILKIATKKQHQQSGFASSLFNYIAKDFKEIFLEVNETNKKAIKFYENLGFEQIGLRKSYYANNENAINLVYKGR